MLKKLLLILACTNLCATEEEMGNPKLTSYEAVGIGIAAFVVYTVIPKFETSEGIFGKHLTTAVGAALCLYSASQLYSMVRDIQEQNTQSEEKKARINEARRMNELINAKRGFRNCLINHINSPRNDSGRPVACEDLASMLAMIAGQAELDKMTTTFNSLYRN